MSSDSRQDDYKFRLNSTIAGTEIDTDNTFYIFSTLSAINAVQIILAYKNSSGDEIANVNLLRRYRTRTSKYQKENLLRLAN